MKHRGWVSLLAGMTGLMLLSVLILPLAADERIVTPFGAKPFVIRAADGTSLSLDFNLPEYALTPIESPDGHFVQIEAEGAGLTGLTGGPELPAYSTFLVIPDEGGVSCHALPGEIASLDLRPAPVSGEDETWAYSPKLYDESFPTAWVRVSEPMIFRDLRVVQLVVYPFRWNAATSRLERVSNLRIGLNWTNEPAANSFQRTSRTISAEFTPLYESMVLNFKVAPWLIGLTQSAPNLLVICQDSFVTQVEPFLNWKRKNGYDVRLLRLRADIGRGGNPASPAIYAWLRTFYDSTRVKPDHILLVGDVTMSGPGDKRMPDYPYTSPYFTGTFDSDYKYSLLVGSDFLPEVYIGRWSIDQASELNAIVAKEIRYESNPTADGGNWLTRVSGVAGNYSTSGSGHPITPRLTILWIRNLLLERGVTNADTFFWVSTRPAPPTDSIQASFNRGAGFILYRGWAGETDWLNPNWGNTQLNTINNGWMTPVVTSVVCNTGRFNGRANPSMGELWLRKGDAVNGGGGVFFYGATDGDTHTKWNNPNAMGFYWGVYEEGLVTAGAAALRAKFAVWDAFPDSVGTGGAVEHYFNVFNNLGDPALKLWTAPPDTTFYLVVSPTFSEGDEGMMVRVQAGTARIAGATVTALGADGTSLLARGVTDSLGETFLAMPATLTSDSLTVTGIKAGYRPRTNRVTISRTRRVRMDASFVDDMIGGDGDGNFEYGETIQLGLVVTNSGSTPINACKAYLHFSDPAIEMGVDPVMWSAPIPAGESATSDITVTIRSPLGGAYPPDTLWIGVVFMDGFSTIGQTRFGLGMDLARLELDSIHIGGDGVLHAGALGTFSIALRNTGTVPTGTVHATLRTALDPCVGYCGYIMEQTYADVAAGATSTGSGEFSLVTDPTLPQGWQMNFILHLDDGSLAYDLPITLHAGEADWGDPTGPDAYGYIAYDCYDSLSGRRPAWGAWTEIGTSGTNLSLADDSCTVVSLPFNFVYYGQTFSQITVSSNGWIAPGNSPWNTDDYNYPVPGWGTPDGMIAVWWDRLKATDSARVLTYSSGDSFIVQWTGWVVYDYSTDEDWTNAPEKFQWVLYSPTFKPTPTGDCEFETRYKVANDLDNKFEYCTVGIESPDRMVGLQYIFDQMPSPGARQMVTNHAIRWTTRQPQAMIPVIRPPERYHNYDRTVAELLEIAATHPSLVAIETLGVTGTYGRQILAAHVTADVAPDLDRPTLEFVGGIHAEELPGVEAAFSILHQLVDGYGADSAITDKLTRYQFYIVPLMNPDGNGVVFGDVPGAFVPDSTYRKNCRDNNGDGRLTYSGDCIECDSDTDGVDLNRNWDLNWVLGTSIYPYNDSYRGPSMWSEPEVVALRDLAMRTHPVYAVYFHTARTRSYQEMVIYPWNWGAASPRYPVDTMVINSTARTLAAAIPAARAGRAYTAVFQQTRNGNATDWHYQALGTFCFHIEMDTTPVAPVSRIDTVAARVARGCLGMTDRLRGSGLTGLVTDASSGNPLDSVAIVVVELNSDFLSYRRTNPRGRYIRLLPPGTYTIEVRRRGYGITRIESVVVGDTMITLDIPLAWVGVEDDNPSVDADLQLEAVPNPTNGLVRFSAPRSLAGTQVALYAADGSCISTVRLDADGTFDWDASAYPAGVYSAKTLDGRLETRVVLIK